MRWYAVYRKSDGSLYSTGTVVVAETLDPDLDFVEIAGESQPDHRAWNSETFAFDLPVPPDPRPVAVDTLVDRFTPQERAAIRYAIRQGDEVVEDFWETLRLKTVVDLADAQSQTWFDALVAARALTPARRAEIAE